MIWVALAVLTLALLVSWRQRKQTELTRLEAERRGLGQQQDQETNAWKFTGKCAKARIEFGRAPDSGGEATFFVRDNGMGFDMAYSGKLFGAFQRLHDASEFQGSGIGLAIAQRILSRQGGRVWAEAEVDKGATFFFSLPA